MLLKDAAMQPVLPVLPTPNTVISDYGLRSKSLLRKMKNITGHNNHDIGKRGK